MLLDILTLYHDKFCIYLPLIYKLYINCSLKYFQKYIKTSHDLLVQILEELQFTFSSSV